MSRKTEKIAALTASLPTGVCDPHYLGYFKCFNQGLFFEAHDVLEPLWLAQRQGPNASFFKGLIQLAGAFVLLRKNRLHPAGRLLKLAQTNLQPYPRQHEHLDLQSVRNVVSIWLNLLENNNFDANPLIQNHPPLLAEPNS
jgi:predicted metal-dependent hydrolase